MEIHTKILARLEPEIKSGQSFQQLSLFSESPLPQKREKRQILSSPGVHPKNRDRYRVILGNQILGDRLSLDEALKLAKGGER